MDDKLLIDVARLADDGETFEGVLDDTVLALDDPYLSPFAGLRYALSVQQLGRELLVRGRLEQDFAGVCSRCGADFDFTVHVDDFTASYACDEKSEFVDLTGDVRESIILHLPTYPVCRSDCRGICAQCGKNLNDGPCACSAERHDSRWDVLDDLTKGE